MRNIDNMICICGVIISHVVLVFILLKLKFILYCHICESLKQFLIHLEQFLIMVDTMIHAIFVYVTIELFLFDGCHLGGIVEFEHMLIFLFKIILNLKIN
jgi:hypothetical protein